MSVGSPTQSDISGGAELERSPAHTESSREDHEEDDEEEEMRGMLLELMSDEDEDPEEEEEDNPEGAPRDESPMRGSCTSSRGGELR